MHVDMLHMFCLNWRNFCSSKKVLKIVIFFSISTFDMEVSSGSLLQGKYNTHCIFNLKKAFLLQINTCL